MKRPGDSWRRARATLVLCAILFTCWLVTEALGQSYWASVWGGFTPSRVLAPYDGATAPGWAMPLTATLVHAGLLHVAFNCAALAFAGHKVEKVLGATSLVILFLLGAYAAAAGDWLVNPAGRAPLIGASGAVSAIVGAYAILFGRNQLGRFRGRIAIWLNALWILAVWIVLTLLIEIAAAGSASGLFGWPLLDDVTVHSAPFILGALLANPLLRFRWRKA